MSIADEITNEITRLQTAKANIKNAIINKGGILTTETLDQYASVIDTISTGTDISDANALVDDVLINKTFYSTSGGKKTGTMADNGTVNTNIITKAQEVTIAGGKHSGSGKVKISSTEQAKIVANNIKSGVSILGQAGGLTPAKAEETKTVTPNVSSGNVVVTPTSGKVMTQVTINKDGNLIADNIKSGVTIFGITGTYSGVVIGYTLTVSLSSNYGSSVTVKHVDGTQSTYPESTTSIADVTEIISITHSDTNGSFTVNGSSVSLPYTLTQNSTLVGAFSCLTGDMLITMADNSTKRLDEIEVDDEILSYDWNTMKLVPNKVIFTDKDENKSFIEYHKWAFDDGTIIKTVHRHEFYSVEEKQFKYMDMWSIGEHTYKQDGSMPMLVSHELITEDVRHYKITGELGTNYFVNGLLNGDRNCPKHIELGGNNK